MVESHRRPGELINTAESRDSQPGVAAGILGSILLIRGQRAVLDTTLAETYGVTTRRLCVEVHVRQNEVKALLDGLP